MFPVDVWCVNNSIKDWLKIFCLFSKFNLNGVKALKDIVSIFVSHTQVLIKSLKLSI